MPWRDGQGDVPEFQYNLELGESYPDTAQNGSMQSQDGLQEESGQPLRRRPLTNQEEQESMRNLEGQHRLNVESSSRRRGGPASLDWMIFSPEMVDPENLPTPIPMARGDEKETPRIKPIRRNLPS